MFQPTISRVISCCAIDEGRVTTVVTPTKVQMTSLGRAMIERIVLGQPLFSDISTMLESDQLLASQATSSRKAGAGSCQPP